jgi:hypothetical protein
MNIKNVLLCALAVISTHAGFTYGGPVYSQESIKPSGSSQTSKTKMRTYLECYDAYNGDFLDCGYDFLLTGIKQPDSDKKNNGGHTHGNTHPLGKLQVIWPTKGSLSTTLYGQTKNDYVYFSHEIPEVSGKIEAELNVRVPQGWYTVSPESCDASYKSWCYKITVDVGLELSPLPDNASPFYIKNRRPNQTSVDHKNDVAFYGTNNAITNLYKIADWYNWLTNLQFQLSINDMSLIRGGLFDIRGNYSTPHKTHRTGESVDINKDTASGVQLDCTKNKLLAAAVFLVIRPEAGTIFAGRVAPSWGHFLCETTNDNNIHIDL